MAGNYRWQFYNPSTGQNIRFPLNPSEQSLPQREKTVEALTTTSPNGQPLIFEGREKPRTFPLTGVILTQEHYQFMVNWYDTKVACRITDELGNVFWLYLTKFNPKRKNRTNSAWAMDFDAEALVTG